MTTIWTVVGGGLVGSGLTYGLTWVREHRRTNDAYRSPQRVAVGDIIEASYEMTLRVLAFRDVMEEMAKEIRDVSDAEANEAQNQVGRAFVDVNRAFYVGRITIVDAECFEAMAEAYNNFAKIEKALEGVGELAPTVGNVLEKINDIVSLTRGLNKDVVKLVKAAQEHLSPVQTWRNKRRRAKVRERLEAKYFPPVSQVKDI